jgi:omega-amidase
MLAQGRGSEKKMKLKISLGQIDVVLGSPAENLAKVAVMTAEAARRGSNVVVFPELWSTGYDLENAAEHATGIDQGIFADVAGLAQEHQIHVLGSCLSVLKPGKYGNTAVLLGPGGQALADYSKIHLFRLMDEEQYLTAGDHLTLVDTVWGRTGLAICYDLRFPELFRAYALGGARIVFLPSEWPHPRLAHWQILLRARAIENQMYIVACNRVGRSKEIDFFGHSCVIDPWGEIIIEGGESEMLLSATIDLQTVDTVRAKIPIFADRRRELYS